MDSTIICILKTSKSMLPVQISPLRSQLSYLITFSFPLAISQRHLKLILDFPLKLDYPICLLPMKETAYHPVHKQEIWASFYFLLFSIPFASTYFSSIPFHITPACPHFPIPTATISVGAFPISFPEKLLFFASPSLGAFPPHIAAVVTW